MKKKLKLHATEDIITKKATVCFSCCFVIAQNKPAVLLVYTYMDTMFPVYFEDDLDLPSYAFRTACTECGEIHRVHL